MKFKSGTYDLQAIRKSGENDEFKEDESYSHLNSKRIASGKDFDENTGKLKKPDSVVLLDETAAGSLLILKNFLVGNECGGFTTQKKSSASIYYLNVTTRGK